MHLLDHSGLGAQQDHPVGTVGEFEGGRQKEIVHDGGLIQKVRPETYRQTLHLLVVFGLFQKVLC